MFMTVGTYKKDMAHLNKSIISKCLYIYYVLICVHGGGIYIFMKTLHLSTQADAYWSCTCLNNIDNVTTNNDMSQILLECISYHYDARIHVFTVCVCVCVCMRVCTNTHVMILLHAWWDLFVHAKLQKSLTSVATYFYVIGANQK